MKKILRRLIRCLWSDPTPAQTPPAAPSLYVAWARNFGPEGYRWRKIFKHRSEFACQQTVKRWVGRYPGISACVLPDGIDPEPPMCTPPDEGEP